MIKGYPFQYMNIIVTNIMHLTQERWTCLKKHNTCVGCMIIPIIHLLFIHLSVFLVRFHLGLKLGRTLVWQQFLKYKMWEKEKRICHNFNYKSTKARNSSFIIFFLFMNLESPTREGWKSKTLVLFNFKKENKTPCFRYLNERSNRWSSEVKVATIITNTLGGNHSSMTFPSVSQLLKLGVHISFHVARSCGSLLLASCFI